MGCTICAWIHNRMTTIRTTEEEEDEEKRHIRLYNNSQKLRSNMAPSLLTSDNEKAVVLSIDGFSFKKTDITDKVREANLDAQKNDYDQYKDIEYLAVRAKMKIDDPKFDPDFL